MRVETVNIYINSITYIAISVFNLTQTHHNS